MIVYERFQEILLIHLGIIYNFTIHKYLKIPNAAKVIRDRNFT